MANSLRTFQDSGVQETARPETAQFSRLRRRRARHRIPCATGNLTDDGNQQYAWDLFNRLREVKTSTGSLIVTYLYDAGNRRVRKDFPAGSSYTDTDYCYVGWQVLEETDTGSTTPNRQYVDGVYIDEHLVMDVNQDEHNSCIGANDSRRFCLHNTPYSAYGSTDNSGSLFEAYEYDPYGRHILLTRENDANSLVDFAANDARTTEGASTKSNPHAFAGQRSGEESSVSRYRSRYYDSQRGRFLSRDVIGFLDAPSQCP